MSIDVIDLVTSLSSDGFQRPWYLATDCYLGTFADCWWSTTKSLPWRQSLWKRRRRWLSGVFWILLCVVDGMLLWGSTKKFPNSSSKSLGMGSHFFCLLVRSWVRLADSWNAQKAPEKIACEGWNQTRICWQWRRVLSTLMMRISVIIRLDKTSHCQRPSSYYNCEGNKWGVP